MYQVIKQTGFKELGQEINEEVVSKHNKEMFAINKAKRLTNFVTDLFGIKFIVRKVGYFDKI